MKKISLLLLISASSLFLTGCWKRKKIAKENKNLEIALNSNVENGLNEVLLENSSEVNAINYIDPKQEYQICQGKTIFADDELIEQNEESNVLLQKEEKDALPFVDQIMPVNEGSNVKGCDTNFDTLQKQKEQVGVLFFEFDAAGEIKDSSKDVMRLIINKLNELSLIYSNIEVIIEGHACNSCGSERYNLALSDERAKTVKNKIIAATSIKAENILETGCGTAHIIVPGNRIEQAPNRRAEVFVILK